MHLSWPGAPGAAPCGSSWSRNVESWNQEPALRPCLSQKGSSPADLSRWNSVCTLRPKSNWKDELKTCIFDDSFPELKLRVPNFATLVPLLRRILWRKQDSRMYFINTLLEYWYFCIFSANSIRGQSFSVFSHLNNCNLMEKKIIDRKK